MAVTKYEKDGRIAIFTINRPEKLNAMDYQVFHDLHDALVDMRDDPEVWVGIITGAGDKAFSAGHDVGEIKAGQQTDLWTEPLPATITRGFELWKPLIAAVNGLAYGGGLALVLGCDIRIASEKARFWAAQLSLGLIPIGGCTARLPRMIPWCNAAEVLLMGRRIDAQEACRIGLVNKVVPPKEVMSTAKEWAEEICQVGPLAVRAAKEVMIRSYAMSLQDSLRLEKLFLTHLRSTEDCAEGIRAFKEKRKPAFKGK